MAVQSECSVNAKLIDDDFAGAICKALARRRAALTQSPGPVDVVCLEKVHRAQIALEQDLSRLQSPARFSTHHQERLVSTIVCRDKLALTRADPLANTSMQRISWFEEREPGACINKHHHDSP